MVLRYSGFPRNKYGRAKVRYRDYRKLGPLGDPTPYSPGKGAIYSFVLAMLLWWIPIGGPAIAGYISGRKSGSSSSALQVSLISAAVIIFLMFALLPFKGGFLGFTGKYLSSGIAALASSSLFSSSSVVTSLYVGSGIIRTFTLVVPSSVLTFVIFSYVGGTYSEFKRLEGARFSSGVSRARTAVYYRTKNSIPLEVRTTGLKPWAAVRNDGDEDEEDGFGLSSIE